MHYSIVTVSYTIGTGTPGGTIIIIMIRLRVLMAVVYTIIRVMNVISLSHYIIFRPHQFSPSPIEIFLVKIHYGNNVNQYLRLY